ncbi:uncharacterized protein LOC117316462 [Pecten maximus]|uniref:uncharacterized protein LOC117316462 n=1 Tax=Pecten maximus TaxID=6579 RepID=UPI001457FD6A|nr:uncharacterized protein LOC117316462 [Pecten maximus]XP_033726947.1 uncharacterized protein LOC117316462 [Pecten maximus]XP_033726948.1 uncharacterized protein LOC117316462 [Pecten maximus]XP_033726949.1 uncharacterized protein LOC117316462 [Pecten maximus]
MFAMHRKLVRYVVLVLTVFLLVFIILKRQSVPTSLSQYWYDPAPLTYSSRDGIESKINEKLNRPLKGEAFSPVITQFLKGKGKSSPGLEIQTQAVSLLKTRDTLLTLKEQDMVQQCKRTAIKDRSRDYGRFFNKETEGIRRTHHTYLNENSLMMEVGGNWGWDAGNFTKLYNPRYIILEPLEPYVEILEKKFENKSNVNVYNLGLGAKNETIMVKIEGNNACATSKFSGKGGNVPIFIIEATSFMTSLGVGVFDVDLLTLNCEGCEFEALNNLLSYNIIENFKNIQWATHSLLKGVKDPIGQYCKITALLSRTHRPTYQYKLNWESWRRKDIK